MAVLSLCKAGYGTVKEIEDWDTDQFFDAIEYEEIAADIQAHKMKEASNGCSKRAGK